MINKLNIFLNKKILVYGLGKSGIASYKFLKDKSDVYLYDDFKSNIQATYLKKKSINYSDISKIEFDKIVISPGIDINKCKLSKFLKKNKDKIYSDLDIFYAFYKNDSITITGTNGKSTTSQLLYEVLLNQKFNVKLLEILENQFYQLRM